MKLHHHPSQQKNSKELKKPEHRKKRHKKDFSWNEQAKNPFHSPEKRTVARERIRLIILIAIVLSTLGIILYHPMFQVKSVQVSGLQRISETEFIDATIGIFDSFSPLLIIPGTNYFFLHIEKTTEILAARFPLASISITKVFPNQLSIAVTEKVSTIIYDNGLEYSYIGLDGSVIETIRTIGDNEWIEEYTTTTSTLTDGRVTSTQVVSSRTRTIEPSKIVSEMGDYPYIYHADADTASSSNTTVLSPSVIEHILTWHQESKFHHYVPDIYYIEVREQGRNVKLMLDRYRYIRIDATTIPADQQIAQLKQAQKRINTDFTKYIDLRYAGRVYWQ